MPRKSLRSKLRGANSPTNPRMLKVQQRRFQALELKKAGHSFREVGKMLGCNEATAHRDVVQCIHESKVITRQMAAEQYFLEMERYEELHKAWWPKAKDNIEAAEFCRRLAKDRQTLSQLRSDSRSPLVNFNFGGEGASADARVSGVQVSFTNGLPPDHEWRKNDKLLLEHEPSPTVKTINNIPDPQPAAAPNEARPLNPNPRGTIPKSEIAPADAEDTPEARKKKALVARRLNNIFEGHGPRAEQEGWNIPNPYRSSPNKLRGVKGGWMAG